MAKERRGVTLIALVITIIVLLILAGVTIAMLTGDNGIISKAMQAKNKTEEARKTEEAGLKKIENYINGKSAEAGVVIQDLKSIKSDGTEGEVIGKKDIRWSRRSSTNTKWILLCRWNSKKWSRNIR